MKYLIIGTAGFIGFHVAKKILRKGDYVLGLDNINDYYNTRMKYARLNELGIEKKGIKHNKILNSKIFKNHQFINIDLEDRTNLENVLGKKAKINFQPLQLGDLKNTYADIDDLIKDFNFKLKIPFKEGIKHFINWFISYYE